MTLISQPPSPNQPPVPTPAPPPAPTPADPQATIAAAHATLASFAAPNSAAFVRQVDAVQGIGETLTQQLAAFTDPLPADEVWLRVAVGVCMGGREDLAEAAADRLAAAYGQRFRVRPA